MGSLPVNSLSASAEKSKKPKAAEKSHEEIFIESLRKKLVSKEISLKTPWLMKAVPVDTVPVEGDSRKHEVFTPDGSREKTCTVHATKRAIFSTVTSYAMTVEFDEKRTVNFTTEKEGKFKLAPLKDRRLMKILPKNKLAKIHI